VHVAIAIRRDRTRANVRNTPHVMRFAHAALIRNNPDTVRTSDVDLAAARRKRDAGGTVVVDGCENLSRRGRSLSVGDHLDGIAKRSDEKIAVRQCCQFASPGNVRDRFDRKAARNRRRRWVGRRSACGCGGEHRYQGERPKRNR
jgi:hypothetical protein